MPPDLPSRKTMDGEKSLMVRCSLDRKGNLRIMID